MNFLNELIKAKNLSKKNEISIAEGIEEAAGVEKVLIALSGSQQGIKSINAVDCVSHWNSFYRTYTYHTHTVVDDFNPGNLDKIAYLFFNAYSLDKQGWYSQFVCGVNKPLPGSNQYGDENIMLKDQLGQGYFDFGLPLLRRYQAMFSLRRASSDSFAIIIRSIDHPFTVNKKSKKVFLLAPTGDYFVLEGRVLHWHHICTVTGVGLLPGMFDKYFMNLIRSMRLDSKERETYKDEANAFINFARGL